MNESQAGPVLDSVPAFDRLEEEPELDIIFTTRRLPSGNSTYGVKIRVNGQPVKPTKPQKDFAAAVLRLGAHHLSHQNTAWTKSEAVLFEAREAFWQMRLALDYGVDMLKALVALQGPDNAARLLNMRLSTVEALCAAPSSERPNLLAGIGAFNVSRKERHRVAKTLASLSLLPLADDRRRGQRPFWLSPPEGTGHEDADINCAEPDEQNDEGDQPVLAQPTPHGRILRDRAMG